MTIFICNDSCYLHFTRVTLLVEEGTIKRLDGQNAWVITRRTEACHQCEARGACHALGSGKEVEVMARNSVRAREGDRVLLSLESRPMLVATFLVYMVPLLLMLVGGFIGLYAAPRLAVNPDLAALVCGGVFFGVTLWIVRRKGRELGTQKEYIPEVIKVIEGGSHG